jgi:hypothetical protein
MVMGGDTCSGNDSHRRPIIIIAMFRFAVMVLAIAYALPCERGDFVVGTHLGRPYITFMINVVGRAYVPVEENEVRGGRFGTHLSQRRLAFGNNVA